jgi:pSer/pThr/pTyr-binding forkhead associated (FHA) protein
MSRREILIEHYYNKKFLEARCFKASTKQILFGSSICADLILMGPEVHGLHAMVEFDKEGWKLIDLASPTGTLVNGKAIVEHPVTDKTICTIGPHEIHLHPVEIEPSLFATVDEDENGELCHQVVVRKGPHVIHSCVLPPTGNFLWQDVVFPPPTSHEWEVHDLEGLAVHQRLSRAPRVILEKEKFELSKNEKMSLMGVGALALVFALVVLLNTGKDAPAITEQKNVYAKMILDPKVLKEKRQEAKKIVERKVAQKTPGPTSKLPNKVASAPTSSKDGPKVLTNIRTAQLGKIIGRISERADVSRGLASAVGPNPSTSRLRGSGLPSVQGSGVQVGNGTAANSKYQIEAVGTSGRGGGVSDMGGVGALATGGVGAANVGLIEEEGEVDGGLDKEVIAAYIKSQLGQIRYCYERQLSANPDLYGKVQIQFTIAASGHVSQHAIGQTTLKSAMVEGCILRRVAQWKFPEPKGGIEVRVTYPFLFKSTN